MRFLLQALKEDTISTVGGIDDNDTSFSLTAGNFSNTTGTQRAIFLLDYDVAAKREYVTAAISGSSISSVVRAKYGTSAVAHAQNAKVLMVFTTGHWDYLSNATQDGWVDALETWTYASATTFTVAGTDLTTILSAGDKLRVKQGGSYKYFVIVSVAFSTNTTVTVDGRGTYTLANAAITDNYYSKAETPNGFDLITRQLGYAESTSNQTGITTEVDLTNLTTTVVVPTGKRIRITAFVLVSNNGTAGRTTVFIKEGSTYLQSVSAYNAIASAQATCFGAVVLTPSAGSHTYKLSAEANAGTTNTGGSATTPQFILVEVLN